MMVCLMTLGISLSTGMAQVQQAPATYELCQQATIQIGWLVSKRDHGGTLDEALGEIQYVYTAMTRPFSGGGIMPAWNITARAIYADRHLSDTQAKQYFLEHCFPKKNPTPTQVISSYRDGESLCRIGGKLMYDIATARDKGTPIETIAHNFEKDGASTLLAITPLLANKLLATASQREAWVHRAKMAYQHPYLTPLQAHWQYQLSCIGDIYVHKTAGSSPWGDVTPCHNGAQVVWLAAQARDNGLSFTDVSMALGNMITKVHASQRGQFAQQTDAVLRAVYGARGQSPDVLSQSSEAQCLAREWGYR